MSLTDTLPSHASVVVVGGGVMGCSTLYHLTKQGITDAVLIERNQLTSGATWHSAAQVRALRSSRNLTDMIKYSISLYSSLEEETGQAVGWINKGSLSIATSEDRLVHTLRQKALADLFGVRAETVDRDEAASIWPLMNTEDVIGAVWSPDDGRVSPSDLCAALVKGARSRGARIFENTGVEGIVTKNGQVTALETTQGTIRCDAVALCTGLWSQETAGFGGAPIPVWPCEHFYLLTEPVDGISGNLPTLSDHDSHLYIRDDSGGLLIGCFEPLGKPISPGTIGRDFAFSLLPEDWEHFEPMMMNAMHRLPPLADAGVKTLLNGPESFTPDGAFLLGETAETRGLFLGCGMNSVGVASAGGAGMALAHCIEHGHTPVDLSEVDPKRFPDAFNSAQLLTERVPEVLGKHYEITYPGRQWDSARNIRQFALYSRWQREAAHFGQFYGFERPLYFGKAHEPKLTFGKPDWHDHVAAEVRAAHESAAVFDQSSFGKIDVSGSDALTLLDAVCVNRVDRAVGSVIYSSMLNERGTLESDLTLIRLEDTRFRLYTGTTAIKRDIAWLRRHAQTLSDINISDVTEDFAVIGLMGPGSIAIANHLATPKIQNLGYFKSADCEFANVSVHAARLSYVGEPGWELTCRSTDAVALVDALIDAGARPAGLFAQTSMRIEKQYLAWGHELDTDISPLEAGLEFAVDWNKEFIGKAALEQRRATVDGVRIVSIVLDDRDAVPIGNEPVIADGKIIGKTTSAAYGFRIDAPVALADVGDVNFRADGKRVEIDIAGELKSGVVHTQPAFDPKGMRMRASV